MKRAAWLLPQDTTEWINYAFILLQVIVLAAVWHLHSTDILSNWFGGCVAGVLATQVFYRRLLERSHAQVRQARSLAKMQEARAEEWSRHAIDGLRLTLSIMDSEKPGWREQMSDEQSAAADLLEGLAERREHGDS